MFSVRQYVTWYVANYRRTLYIRFLAKICKNFLMCYENSNYSPRHNGEKFVLEALPKKKISYLFDVGANTGKWTLLAHEIFPSATIHSFEIIESTYEKLKSNVKNVPNIIANSFGLSDKEGFIKLKYFPDASTLSSIVEFPHNREHTITTGRVMTGDAYIKRQAIDQIGFLKIDVEGAEHLVLRGFSDAIRNGKIDVVQFEYGQANILTKFLLRDFYEFFQKHNYIVGKIYPNYVDFRDYDLEHEDFIGPNYLAIRQERYDLIHLLT